MYKLADCAKTDQKRSHRGAIWVLANRLAHNNASRERTTRRLPLARRTVSFGQRHSLPSLRHLLPPGRRLGYPRGGVFAARGRLRATTC